MTEKKKYYSMFMFREKNTLTFPVIGDLKISEII